MGRFLLAVTVLLVLVAAACALKCFECLGTEEDCKKSTLEGNPSKYLKTCQTGLDKCYRVWAKVKNSTAVRNGCTSHFDCEVQSKALCAAYDDIDGVECKFSCCDEDACNAGSHVSFTTAGTAAGSPVSFSFFLLTVISVLGLALMM